MQSNPLDLADRRDFGFVSAVSENGDWLAVGSPYSTVPVNRSSVFVETENGTSFLANGAIFESGEVYIFQRSFEPSGGPIGGNPPGERVEKWSLFQVIRSPATSPFLAGPQTSLIARDVFREKFGYSIDLSPDGKTLLVGAWGGGGRLSFEDSEPFSSRGISYVFNRGSLEDKFAFKRPFAGRSRPSDSGLFRIDV